MSIFGIAFAAFCVWLTVRIINRRERWAKWTAVGLIVALAYPLSFGPACWISERTKSGEKALSAAYQPILRLWMRGGFSGRIVYNYASVGTKSGSVSIHRNRADGWLTFGWSVML